VSEVNRFFIAERYADNGELSHRALVDAADGRELGTDGGEPEDQSFWRDWAWVPDEMNKLGNEIVTIRDERDRLRANLVNCVARLEAYYGEDYPAVRDAKAALTPAGSGNGRNAQQRHSMP